MTLFHIAQKYNTDKTLASPTHEQSCLHIYERIMQGLDAFKSVRILEIGVRHGGSINMLLERFPHAQVVGLDIEDCEFDVYNIDRYEFFKGSQTDINVLEGIVNKYESFDLIIDDGSHLISDYVNTFLFLFRYLRKNGLYIIEDLQNNYPQHNLTRSTRPNGDGKAFEQFQGTLLQNIHLGKTYDFSSVDPKVFSIHHYPGFMVLTKSHQI